jgi:hypothetical protein
VAALSVPTAAREMVAVINEMSGMVVKNPAGVELPILYVAGANGFEVVSGSVSEMAEGVVWMGCDDRVAVSSRVLAELVCPSLPELMFVFSAPCPLLLLLATGGGAVVVAGMLLV